jgi:intracellular sulfur oxidation DsrE/DsrF family protein
MKTSYLSIILSMVVFSSSIFASEKIEPIKGPIFTDYGPVYQIADRAVQLPENFAYKAVFDISKSAEEPNQYNRQLESVARFINMHALNGVPLDKMDIAVVFHGGATKDLLNNKTYQKKFSTDNPSLDLEHQLRSKGVKFYLCGQSMSFSGYSKQELDEPNDLALSAMTMFVVLQQQGYQFIP